YREKELIELQHLLLLKENGPWERYNEYTFFEHPCGSLTQYAPFIECEGGLVLRIDLTNNNLAGKLNDNIGYLEHLEVLQLGNNKIYGSIPASISNMRKLRTLNLENNMFSGVLPGSLCNGTYDLCNVLGGHQEYCIPSGLECGSCNVLQ